MFGSEASGHDARCEKAAGAGDEARLRELLALGAPSPAALCACLAKAASKVMDGCFDLLIPLASWPSGELAGWAPLAAAVERGRPGRAARLIAKGAPLFDPGEGGRISIASLAKSAPMLSELAQAAAPLAGEEARRHRWELAMACARVGAPREQLSGALAGFAASEVGRGALEELALFALDSGSPDNLGLALDFAGPWLAEDGAGLDSALAKLCFRMAAAGKLPSLEGLGELLSRGMDPKAVDAKGRSVPMALLDHPLMSKRPRFKMGSSASFEAFVERGCPMGEPDRQGRTLAEMAKRADSEGLPWLAPAIARAFARAEKAQIGQAAGRGSAPSEGVGRL